MLTRQFRAFAQTCSTPEYLFRLITKRDVENRLKAVVPVGGFFFINLNDTALDHDTIAFEQLPFGCHFTDEFHPRLVSCRPASFTFTVRLLVRTDKGPLVAICVSDTALGDVTNPFCCRRLSSSK